MTNRTGIKIPRFYATSRDPREIRALEFGYEVLISNCMLALLHEHGRQTRAFEPSRNIW